MQTLGEQACLVPDAGNLADAAKARNAGALDTEPAT
jgi:hypothetical protein